MPVNYRHEEPLQAPSKGAPGQVKPRIANATPQQRANYEQAFAEWQERQAEHEHNIVPKWKTWRPQFRAYDVVLCIYHGDAWPDDVRRAFVDYVRNGGGVVIVYAANNAFADWPEYNEIIGLGGWEGRDERWGPYVRWGEGGLSCVARGVTRDGWASRCLGGRQWSQMGDLKLR